MTTASPRTMVVIACSSVLLKAEIKKQSEQ